MESIVKYLHLDVYKGLVMLLLKHGHHELVHTLGLGKGLSKNEFNEGTSTAHKAIEDLPDDIQKLGPTFVKIGQLLAGRADLLPLEYMQSLERLQDSCEAMPFETVRAVIEEELGGRLEDHFARMDEVPLGAASLGQVHRAWTHLGRDVAVKVQRPDIRKQMISDLQAIAQVADLLTEHTDWGYRHQLAELVTEFRHTLMRELDYQQEAENLSRLATNISDFDTLFVPQPIEDLTSPRVLTMDFVDGRKIKTLRNEGATIENGEVLAEDLFRAYLQQVLVDGFYHADPHPGNIMLTCDGRIALIDLGMVGKIPPRLRERVLSLVMAASDGRSEDVIHMAIEIGHVLETFDRRKFSQRVNRLVMDRYKTRAEGMAAGRLMLGIAEIAGDTGLFVPTEIAVLGKALVNLESVGEVLSPDFDVDASIRRNMSRMVNRRLLQSLSPGTLLSGMLETKELIGDLPRRVATILDNVANNEARLRIDAVDEERLITGIRSIANRIAVGLVLAALIIAAAILMSIESRYTLFGYPAMAIVLFIAAAGLGFVLVISTLWTDRDSKPGRRR
jgi:predicted unusual protein kinase regulating ubiquinone biosynthesis (AarF/ABC1/UbiB family)